MQSMQSKAEGDRPLQCLVVFIEFLDHLSESK